MLKRKGKHHEIDEYLQPPSGGCVLKRNTKTDKADSKPAAFRRLCVETLIMMTFI